MEEPDEIVNSQQGQVLVFTGLLLLVPVMFFLVTLNVGRMVAIRIKMQNAVDAAAQTAALWQARGLNLEGHLNMVQESLHYAYLGALATLQFEIAEQIHLSSSKITAAQEKIANTFPGIAMTSAFIVARKNGLDAVWPVNNKDYRIACTLGVKKKNKNPLIRDAFTVYYLDRPKYWSPQERTGPFVTMLGYKGKERGFGLNIIGLKNMPIFVIASARPKFKKEIKTEKISSGWSAVLMPVRMPGEERGRFMGKAVYH